jgi:hypothetical protein
MFKRWYDADSVVSRAINELEKQPEEIQVRCAEYIISLLKDVEIEKLSLEDQYNYIMRRWYDKNIKVSHAIEYLRLSPKELRRETALKTLDYLKEITEETDEISEEENS